MPKTRENVLQNYSKRISHKKTVNFTGSSLFSHDMTRSLLTFHKYLLESDTEKKLNFLMSSQEIYKQIENNHSEIIRNCVQSI